MAWCRSSDSGSSGMKPRLSSHTALALAIVLLGAVMFRVWLNAREAGKEFAPLVHLHHR